MREWRVVGGFRRVSSAEGYGTWDEATLAGAGEMERQNRLSCMSEESICEIARRPTGSQLFCSGLKRFLAHADRYLLQRDCCKCAVIAPGFVKC